MGMAVNEKRDQFVIATKYTASSDIHPLAGGNSRLSMMRSVEGSLRRLGTDHIDLLWLHFWDGTAPVDEILRGVDDCVSSGKVLYFGISNTPAWLVSRAATMAGLRGWVRPAAIQVEYNVAMRDVEREFIPMAEALGLGILAWGPLAAGALASGDKPKRRPKSKVPTQLAEIAAKIASLALELSITPGQLALSWLASRDCAPVPIIGARTTQQFEELLLASALETPKDVLSQIDALAPPKLGYPHDLINSAYLQRFALGNPDCFRMPDRLRF